MSTITTVQQNLTNSVPIWRIAVRQERLAEAMRAKNAAARQFATIP